MSEKAFSLYASLELDADDFEKSLKEVKESFEDIKEGIEDVDENTASLAQTAKTAMTAFAVGFGLEVVKGIGDIIPAAVEAAAEIQAMEAQFDASFGDIAEDAEAALKTIGEETNIVSRRLKTVATKAFSQFAGAGMESAESLEQTELYLQLAADAAAYYDMSLEDVDERLRSFILGNTEAGDMIGLFTSATQRDEKALELYGEKWQNLTEAQKQFLMLDTAREIYTQSGALGQASREAENYSNLLANMDSLRYEILGKIGAPILEALTPIMDEFNDWLESEPEIIDGFAGTLGGLVAGLLDALKGLITWFSENEETITQFVDILTNLFSPGKDELTLKIDTSFEGLEGYTDEAYEALTKYIQAYNAGDENWKQAMLAAKEEDWELLKAYKEWRDTNSVTFQGLNEDELPYLPADVYLAEGTEEAVQDQLDRLDASVTVRVNASVNPNILTAAASYATSSLNNWSSSLLDKLTGTDGSHATGLPYVPYDGYIAELHHGERVLTQLQNAQYNEEQAQRPTTNEADLESLVEAFAQAISGLTIQMDKQTVGSIVSPVVFREMWRQLGNKKFAT